MNEKNFYIYIYIINSPSPSGPYIIHGLYPITRFSHQHEIPGSLALRIYPLQSSHSLNFSPYNGLITSYTCIYETLFWVIDILDSSFCHVCGVPVSIKHI